MHNIAVIVPTRNRPEVLRLNLARTRAHFPSVPIFVFDDASDDEVRVREAVNSIQGTTLIRSTSNVGPAGARRRLIQEASARWLLALDDDCYPRADFDPASWVERDPGKGEPVVIGLRYYRSYDGDVSPSGRDNPGPFPAFHGGASLLHRQSILDVGNYNANYFFAGEDTDLARRVWASGYEVWLDTESYIIHDHVAAGRNLRRESFLYVRNRVLLSVMTLPVWYGLPYGLASAARQALRVSHKGLGIVGIFAGLAAAARHFPERRPLTLKTMRFLKSLEA